MAPRFLIVMGIAGCGKSTVATALAQHLGWAFCEGDGLHPAENIAKMSAGIALTDADRRPWLRAIALHIGGWRAAGAQGVVTCSALKRAYRDSLVAGHGDVHFIYLKAGQALIAERFAARRGHFMPASLIDSQIATLEAPGDDEPALTLDVAQPLPALVAAAAALIR